MMFQRSVLVSQMLRNDKWSWLFLVESMLGCVLPYQPLLVPDLQAPLPPRGLPPAQFTLPPPIPPKAPNGS